MKESPMVPQDEDDVRDDDSAEEEGFTVSREDCEAMLIEFEERMPEMPDDEKPTTVQDVLNMVGGHDHRPSGYRHIGIIEIRADEPAGREGQDGTSEK
jgi:hypothetical protein